MRKEKLYVVGYDNDKSFVWGKDDDDDGIITPVNIEEARELQEEHKQDEAVIYKLVRVHPRRRRNE